MAYSSLYFPVYGIWEKCLWNIKFSEADNIWQIEKNTFFMANRVIYFSVYDI